MKNILSAKNIHKEFKNNEQSICAIENISFDLRDGEILGILGMSGCGKSTLLNIISGLDKEYDGEIITSNELKISYMLQNDALLGFRNILDNACLGLELSNSKDERNISKVKDMLINYGLKDFIYKKPKELSGGMRQRVALIRSLATKPNLILLDEPFSALDYYTRLSISEDVRNEFKRNKQTAIMITHDIQEACLMCDRIIVLTNRPSKVKNIYELNLLENPFYIKRKTDEFDKVYRSIWEDIKNEEQ